MMARGAYDRSPGAALPHRSFTEPAAELENAAKSGDTELAENQIMLIRALSQRIVVPEDVDTSSDKRQTGL